MKREILVKASHTDLQRAKRRRARRTETRVIRVIRVIENVRVIRGARGQLDLSSFRIASARRPSC